MGVSIKAAENKMTKLLVCGSRSISDAAWIKEQISLYVKELNIWLFELSVIEGGAKGVDSFAGEWAIENEVPLEIFKPDWKRFGKGAGVVRNKQMVLAADFVLILWDGISKGTKNDIDLCKKENKTHKVVIKPVKDPVKKTV